MRKVALLACLVLFSLPVMAAPETAAPETTAPATVAPAMPVKLPCETLKARVDAKLQAKGVPSYTLEIVPIEDSVNISDTASGVPASVAADTKVNKGKEVGTCDGGTKRLIYTRGN